MQKFENMDVIAALEAIMHQNTAYYQSDFAYDIKMLREAARSDQPEDKLLLWLSRPSGTFCFRERDVLLKDTQAYNTWKFCGEQTHDRILAYAVELTGAANGTVQGNLYELDYQQHFQHIRDAALPVGANRLIYESGMREIGPKEHFDSRPDKYFGELVRYEMQPLDPELLQAAIRQEQYSREPARPGDFKEHLAALHTGLIEAEAQRIVTDMKRLAAPNSPDNEVSKLFSLARVIFQSVMQFGGNDNLFHIKHLSLVFDSGCRTVVQPTKFDELINCGGGLTAFPTSDCAFAHVQPFGYFLLSVPGIHTRGGKRNLRISHYLQPHSSALKFTDTPLSSRSLIQLLISLVSSSVL